MHLRLKVNRTKGKQTFSIDQDFEKGGLNLSYFANIPKWHSLRRERHGPDESLGKIEWGISIYPMGTMTEKLKNDGAIGMAHFHPAYESKWDPSDSHDDCIFAWAHVSEEMMSTLLTCQMNNVLVDSIVFEVEGEALGHGWEPDGSATVWDTEKSALLTIKSAAFHFAPHDDDLEIEESPASINAVDEKAVMIADSNVWLRATHSRLLWTNALLLALLIAFLWR